MELPIAAAAAAAARVAGQTGMRRPAARGVVVRYTSATALATGGTITTSGGDQIHTFTVSGAFTVL